MEAQVKHWESETRKQKNRWCINNQVIDFGKYVSVSLETENSDEFTSELSLRAIGTQGIFYH